jgi:fimbrial chaperone protein
MTIKNDYLNRFTVVFLIFFMSITWASSIRVSPVRLKLNEKQKMAVLTITNTGDSAINLQLLPKLWTQKDGQNQMHDTQELLVIPPITEIPAKQKQKVRVALLQPLNPPGKFQAYRLNIQQFSAKTEDALKSTGVQMQLGFVLPILVNAQEGSSLNLQWTLVSHGKQARLKIANEDKHAPVALRHVSITSKANQHKIADQKLSGYIFPESFKRLTIKLKHPLKQGQKVMVELKTASHSLKKQLTV